MTYGASSQTTKRRSGTAPQVRVVLDGPTQAMTRHRAGCGRRRMRRIGGRSTWCDIGQAAQKQRFAQAPGRDGWAASPSGQTSQPAVVAIVRSKGNDCAIGCDRDMHASSLG